MIEKRLQKGKFPVCRRFSPLLPSNTQMKVLRLFSFVLPLPYRLLPSYNTYLFDSFGCKWKFSSCHPSILWCVLGWGDRIARGSLPVRFAADDPNCPFSSTLTKSGDCSLPEAVYAKSFWSGAVFLPGSKCLIVSKTSISAGDVEWRPGSGLPTEGAYYVENWVSIELVPNWALFGWTQGRFLIQDWTVRYKLNSDFAFVWWVL